MSPNPFVYWHGDSLSHSVTSTPPMHRTILVESTLSGLVVGLMLGAIAFGALAIVAELLPAGLGRVIERLRTPAMVACLVLVPLAAAALGYLEGRLKLR